MSDGSGWVLISIASFVASHFALSHPLRRPLVAALGEKIFSAVYSLIALLTLGAAIVAYRAAPFTQPLWDVGNALWAVVTVLMLVSSILLLGSLIKNPAFPGGTTPASTAKARGVYGVTRHPMLWAFALWGICHILVFPITKNIIMSGAVIILSLVGAALQDKKKAQLDPLGWTKWQRQTSYVPFAATTQARATFGNFGNHAIVGGLLLWLIATWAHLPLSGWPAGIWRWISL